jgi:hypothetical protein
MMVTNERNDGIRPEENPELMYEYTEEYAEMLKLQDEDEEHEGRKDNGKQY